MAQLKWMKAKGAMGLYYGLGVDEVAVNFENMSGLITLAGGNGHGKTTFLELLSPYPVIKSREIKDPKRYNLKKQFRLRDSYKEVCYLIGGKEYIFRLEIPATTKTTAPEGYIYCDGVPLTKGKITEYKSVLKDIFGSEKLFYSSSFACQGGSKLTDLQPGQFKSLLIELLGLKKYEAYWENTKKCLDECVRAQAVVDAEIKKFDGLVEKRGQIKNSITIHEGVINTENTRIAEADTCIQTKAGNISTYTKQAQEAEKAQVLVDEKQEQLTKLTQGLKDIETSIQAVDADHVSWLDKQAAILKPHRNLIIRSTEIRNAAEAIVSVREEETEWNRQLAEITVNMDASKERGDLLNYSVEVLRESIRQLEQDPDLKRLQEKANEINGNIQTNKTDQETSSQKLSDLNDDTKLYILRREAAMFANSEALLDNRPADCKDDTCPFIADALNQSKLKKAKEEGVKAREAWVKKERSQVSSLLEAMIKHGETLAKEAKENQATIAARKLTLSRETEKLEFKRSTHDHAILWERKYYKGLLQNKTEVSEYLSGVPARVQTLSDLAGKADDLAAAAKIIEHAEAEAATRDADLDVKKRVLYVDLKAKTKEIEQLKQQIEGIRPQISLTTLQQTISTLKTEKEIWEKTLSASRDKKSQSEFALVAHKTNLEQLDKDAVELNNLIARKKFILEEIQKWSYIRDIVSKSGLQALEISAAAPMLTSIANELLHEAFGGEFYLDLITEDPETGAEILDIMITREDGETFPLSAYSGGESVWTLQSFKCAQILVNAEKSGFHCETGFADEETGALDTQKAERFIKMYQALMAIGKFDKIIYISHIPECQAMADHVLTFEKGGIRSESDIEFKQKAA